MSVSSSEDLPNVEVGSASSDETSSVSEEGTTFLGRGDVGVGRDSGDLTGEVVEANGTSYDAAGESQRSIDAGTDVVNRVEAHLSAEIHTSVLVATDKGSGRDSLQEPAEIVVDGDLSNDEVSEAQNFPPSVVVDVPDGVRRRGLSTRSSGTMTPGREGRAAPRTGKRWYKDIDSYRLFLMATMLFTFFWMELIVGIIVNSLALVSDAFHMASDFMSLVVGFAAIQYAKKGRTGEYTYGLARAEVLGGLVNGCFLLSISFFILVEAMQRFFDLPEVHDPLLLTIVAFVGLVINIIGMFLFHSHGHGHGHGKKKKGAELLVEPSERKDVAKVSAIAVAERFVVGDMTDAQVSSDAASSGAGDAVERAAPETVEQPRADVEQNEEGKKTKRKNIALQGVFLHILGDTLASVGVLFSGLCILFMPWDWKYYIDPSVSVVIALIILRSAIPLVRKCSRIFLQRVPREVDIVEIRKCLSCIDGVLGVHDLHVWQIVDRKLVGTCHLLISRAYDSLRIVEETRKILLASGIHSTTVQIESLDLLEERAAGRLEEGETQEEIDVCACAFPSAQTDLVCCHEVQE